MLKTKFNYMIFMHFSLCSYSLQNGSIWRNIGITIAQAKHFFLHLIFLSSRYSQSSKHCCEEITSMKFRPQRISREAHWLYVQVFFISCTPEVWVALKCRRSPISNTASPWDQQGTWSYSEPTTSAFLNHAQISAIFLYVVVWFFLTKNQYMVMSKAA